MSARNRLRKSEEPFVEFLHAVEKALAYSEITATLETWEGKVTVTLWRDGTYTVEVGEKYGSAERAHEGNVEERSR